MDWKDALEQLVIFLTEVAPAIWEVARRQVLVDAIQYGTATLTCGVAGVVASIYTKVFAIKHSDNRYDTYDVYASFCGVAAVGFGVATLALLNTLVGRIINPDYYAIWHLVQFVK